MRRLRHRTLATLLLVAVATAVAAGGYEVVSTARSVPELFRRNAALKAQGYYMAEFEFKMLAGLQFLAQGDYLAAFAALRRIRHELETTEGLTRAPTDGSPDARFEFLLDRQDPVTGAFMDRRYPTFSYVAPTLNALEALAELAKVTGRPARPRHRLAFLDAIAAPDDLRRYLDSLLYLDGFWARTFPNGPGPYGAGISELAYFDLFETVGGYAFSAAWKDAFRAWLDATQDPATGYWGVRVGSPQSWTQRRDPNSTFHILHLVLTPDGRDQSEAYPLRHANRLAASLTAAVATPIPDGADAQHQWALDQAQGLQMLTRLLWNHLDGADRERVRAALPAALAERYRLFRRESGGFALYLGSAADLDGTSAALGLIEATGSLPGTATRGRILGPVSSPPVETVVLTAATDIRLPQNADVNAFRLYAAADVPPDGYDDEALLQIIYPAGREHILDIMDLRQRLGRFLDDSGQDFGNWATRAGLRAAPLALDRRPRSVPVAHGAPAPLAQGTAGTDPPCTILVGYDALQRPVSATRFIRAR